MRRLCSYVHSTQGGQWSLFFHRDIFFQISIIIIIVKWQLVTSWKLPRSQTTFFCIKCLRQIQYTCTTLMGLDGPLENAELKCHYVKNRIFSIKAILKHKEVACMRRKMLFYHFQRSLFVPEIFKFLNMQISEVMTSYTKPNFDQIWWKKISQPVCIRNVWFFPVRFCLMCSTIWA